jgi:hypothetical protein
MFKERPPWVVVASFGTVFEAEFAAATLEEAGIPSRVTGAHLGIWGAGYQGPSMYGVQLIVPWHREEDARALLETLEPDDDHALDPPEETT